MKTKQQRKDTAWKEYKKIQKPALKEYKKITELAYEEYKKKCEEINAEDELVPKTIKHNGHTYKLVK